MSFYCNKIENCALKFLFYTDLDKPRYSTDNKFEDR